MTKYCIIDDEPIAHRVIEGYCEKLPYLEKVGNCYNAFEAMQLLNQTQVDLIFLDINMPELTGFELLKSMPNPPATIVTSAHKEFALEGYELDISDYLLKPFSFARFLKAMNKTIGVKMPAAPAPSTEQGNTHFFIKGDKKMHQIQFEDILFVEAYGNYTKIHLEEEMILSHEKISALEKSLPADEFIRVHKSFIVATKKIKTIEGNRISIEQHKIPIGQTYKNGLMKRVNKR
ncbi:MAG: LytTR family DNA-binding domain-containing protein [Saprospiraceae bacterium]|nr:LytTR family DNA-binding domain-containing protein [Saprospiraceae bacterium]